MEHNCVKTRTIQILPLQDIKVTYDYLRLLSNSLASMGNEIIRRHMLSFAEVDFFKSESETKLTATQTYTHMTEKYGMSLQNMGYHISKKYDNIPSNIRSVFNQKIFKLIKDKYWEISINKISIPSYKKDRMAIPFQKKDIRLEGDDYIFPFFNNLNFKLHFGKDKSNNKVIIQRILSGECKALSSHIKIVKNKIFIDLTFSFTTTPTQLDPEKCLGVDLGINRPLTMAKSDNGYIRQIDIGGKIQLTRMSIQKQRRSIQSALKYSSGGHGTHKKINKLEDLRKYEHNFMKTNNDTISRALIKTCLDDNIGTIKLENLTGITETTNNFLKSWSYFQLQQMIEYKAKEVGIIVSYVDPAYTSQTCPICNNVDKTQRDLFDKTKFTCNNEFCSDYNKTKDADYIGALNISRKEIVNKKDKKIKKKVVESV